MKIHKIHLENVKSYEDETIVFNNGINFICGINGAGKTTIIESIGYALFDAQPGKIGDFVRYGAKRGIITVEFEGNDQRIYRVVRKFGNVNSWLVFDAEMECELDLHGEADVKAWLKDCMGIPQDENLSQLFSDVIGVSQGTFTAPFLTTPSTRRQTFNKLLKVEAYRQAWENTRSVISYIDSDIIAQEEKKQAVLEERVREYDHVKNSISQLTEVIESGSKELELKKESLERDIKKRDSLRGIKADLEISLKEKEIIALNIENLREAVEKLQGQLTAALTAKEKVKQSAEGYSVYIEASKKLEVLEEKRKYRDMLMKQLAEKESAAVKLTTQLSAEREAIMQQQKENSLLVAEKKALIASNQTEIEKAQSNISNMNGIQQKVKEIDQLLNEDEEAVNKFNNIKDRIADGYSKWSNNIETIRKLNENITKEPELKQRLDNLMQLSEELDRYKTEKAALKQKLDILNENIEKTRGGLCPFLNTECKNIDGDLTTYFKSQINEIGSKMKQITENIQQLEQEVQKVDGLRKELSSIEADKKIMIEKSNEKLQYIRAFKHYFTEILRLEFAELFSRLLNKYISLTNELKDYEGIQECIDLADEWKNSCIEIELTLKNYDSAVGVFDEESCSQLEEIVSLASVLYKKISYQFRYAKTMYEKLKDVVAREEQKCSNLYSQLVKKQEMLEEEQKSLSERGMKLDHQLKALFAKEKEVETINSEKYSIQEKLKEYEEVDRHIEGQQALQKANQEAYNEYIKYEQEAKKTEELQEDIAIKESELNEKLKRLTEINEKIESLNKEYDPESLEFYENKVVTLQTEIAVMAKDLEERQNNLNDLNARLVEMEKTKKEIENIQLKIEKYNSIRSMMEYIRSVLNRAGEKVGAVYREYLAHEANKIYREVSRENVCLEWQDDYEVVLMDQIHHQSRRRVFKQLSGGEQMTAALAVRLSLLKQMSNAKVGFFDEPTGNLDSERRSNLAQIIPELTEGFDQLFIISHDDTFDSVTENIIQLKKDQGNGTKRLNIK